MDIILSMLPFYFIFMGLLGLTILTLTIIKRKKDKKALKEFEERKKVNASQ